MGCASFFGYLVLVLCVAVDSDSGKLTAVYYDRP